MNSICVTGRLTGDPHHQPANLDNGGSARTTFRLAIQGPRGEREEGPLTYITVVSHGPTAIAVANHLVKGASVGVHGRLDYRERDDPKGQTPLHPQDHLAPRRFPRAPQQRHGHGRLTNWRRPGAPTSRAHPMQLPNDPRTQSADFEAPTTESSLRSAPPRSRRLGHNLHPP